jgi:F-type H+-transporting ATPase subunit gamma
MNLRPFAKQILTVIADIAVTHRVRHPLLSTNEDPKKVLFVVVTSDRGLAGGFNNNLNRFALKFYNDNKANFENVDFMFVGRRGADFFKSRGIKSTDTILNLAREISISLAEGVADRLMEVFIDGHYDAIYMIYNEFKSAIAQELKCERLLPVDLTNARMDSEGKIPFSKDMIFEPSPELIIENLLKKHFAIQVYRVMSESVAAEHGARMAAMENATKNAGDMIRSMTLTYNKLRQGNITTELIEITSGAEALKG